MKKLALASFVILALPLAVSAAPAYSLTTPLTLTASSSYAGGAGVVDLSVASMVTGTVTIDNDQDGSYWITAGNVAGGQAGYGYFIHDNKIFGVTNDGGGNQTLVLMGYAPAGQKVSVKAAYQPGKGLTFCKTSSGQSWTEYGFGVIDDSIPNQVMHGLGGFYASVTSRNNPANVFVGSWSYEPNTPHTFGSAALCN